MSENNDLVKVWKNNHKIHSYEVDFKSCATLTILCQFMQEAAWNHAEHLGVGFSHLFDKNLIWVLSRQTTKINSFPKWGETITIHTWPSGKDRLFCYRDFKILDEQDNVIGIATTTWFVVDIKKRKPQRTDSYIQLETSDDVEKVFSSFPTKIETLYSIDQTKFIQINFSDLDVNEHVNNVKYIEYILYSFPFEFVKTHKLTLFEINYLSEALYNDEIDVRSEKKGDMAYLHSLMRNNDNTELCRAKTYWEKDS